MSKESSAPAVIGTMLSYVFKLWLLGLLVWLAITSGEHGTRVACWSTAGIYAAFMLINVGMLAAKAGER